MRPEMPARRYQRLKLASHDLLFFNDEDSEARQYLDY